MKQTFTLPTHQDSSSKKVAYINARLLDPESGLDEKGGLLTTGSRIEALGKDIFKDGTPADAEVIDCKGHLLTPGLLDIQVHFREPGQEYKETIATGSRSAAAGGVTTVACMPNTNPVIDSPAMVAFVHKRARETAYCNVRTYGAITKGQKGEMITEMGLLAAEGAVGFTDDGLPVMHSGVMRQALTYARELGLPVAQHAEDLGLSSGTCMNEGKISAQLGVRGVPNAAEAIIVERDILLTALTGAQYHVLHISTAEAVDAVRRAKAKGLNVTAEVAPHHFILTDEAVLGYRTFSKMNPPLRAERDRLAMIEGLKDGTIDAIATDHAPHDQDSKRVPLASASYGIVGLETMLPLSLSLFHKGLLPLREVIASMTYRPADIIHVPAGRLKKGARADLTLIDLNADWSVNPKEFCSKSLNSPFDDYPVKGRAIHTVVGGDTVYTLD
ncbi:MAG: dihydroorotase [Alphaproteobacteria bacterium]